PVHAADAHIRRLAELGHRVAICEQVEDPRALGGRRLVRREVVEVVTPGLVGDPEGLDARAGVALAALSLPEPASEQAGSAGAEAEPRPPRRYGLAVLDASTGDFRATELVAEAGRARAQDLLPDALLQELARIAPRELLVASWAVEDVRRALAPALG